MQRPFLRFTLREGLLLCTVLAVVFGVFGYRLRKWISPANPVDDALVKAATANDEQQVLRWLAAGADPNAGDGQALQQAVAHENGKLVDALLRAGADVNRSRQPLLVLAVDHRDPSVAQRLLAAGAYTEFGSPSPVQACIDKANLKLLELILRHRSSMPLHGLAYALQAGHPEAVEQRIVQLLLDHGADWTDAIDGALSTQDGAFIDRVVKEYGVPYTAREATALNRLNDLQQFLDQDSTLPRQRFRRFPMASAYSEQFLNYPRFEEERSSKRGVEISLLGIALLRGHRDTAVRLLESGAPVDVLEYGDRTLLHHAALGGNAELVQRLIDRGLDVNASDRDGNTPLVLAMAGLSIVWANAPPTAGEYDAWHVLLKDARGPRSFINLGSVNRLLSAGADPFRVGPTRETPLEIARRLGISQELVKVLQAAESAANSKAPRAPPAEATR
jgi:ankyrin repeat protein